MYDSLTLNKPLHSYYSVDSICNKPINIDDLVTKKDLCEDYTMAYKALFIYLCNNNNEKADEYKALLKLHSGDYRITVLSIEIENLKTTTSKIKDLLDE